MESTQSSDKRVLIAKLLQQVNETHHETLVSLAAGERKDREHTLEMAEHVWQKVKGYPIPDSYSEEDRIGIFERYYHRAVSQSQGE